MIRASSLPVAIGASLALHAAAITTLQALPGGWQVGALPDGGVVSAVLHATLSGPAALTDTVPMAKVKHRPAQRAMPSGSAEEVAAASAGGEPKLGLGPMYYPAQLLDERPQVRTHVEPRFPETAAILGGRVVLELYINEQGTVDEVVIVESEPSGFFETAATEAFGAALFRPGHKAGVAVKSRLAIEVLFGTPVPMGPSVAINGDSHD